MKKIFVCFIFCYLGLLFAQGGEYIELSTHEKEQYLKELQVNVQKVKTLACTFKQEKHLEMFDDVLRLKGWAYIRKQPRSIRWEYTSPLKKVVLIDNDEMRVYKWKGNQKKRILSPNEKYVKLAYDYILSFFEGKFSLQDESFHLKIKYNMQGNHLLVFESNENLKKYIQNIQLVISKNNTSIEKVIIYESSKNYTIITFTQIKQNVNLNSEVFDEIKINKFQEGIK